MVIDALRVVKTRIPRPRPVSRPFQLFRDLSALPHALSSSRRFVASRTYTWISALAYQARQTTSNKHFFSMTDNTNPGNFANRPKEEVQAIASKGGKASGGGGSSDTSSGATSDSSSGGSSEASSAGRNADGTFAKGSQAAKEAGQKGGSS